MTNQIEYLINQMSQYEKEYCKNTCSSFRIGISDGVLKVKQFLISIKNDDMEISNIIETVKVILEIEETVNSLNGRTSCLGEEIEYFNATCQVFDYFNEIIKIKNK